MPWTLRAEMACGICMSTPPPLRLMTACRSHDAEPGRACVASAQPCAKLAHAAAACASVCVSLPDVLRLSALAAGCRRKLFCRSANAHWYNHTRRSLSTPAPRFVSRFGISCKTDRFCASQLWKGDTMVCRKRPVLRAAAFAKADRLGRLIIGRH